jgi:hypothetical protein
MHSLSVELGSQSEFRDAAEVEHGWKRMPSIVYSSLDRHIVHPFWIALFAPSCGAVQVM